MKKRRKNDGEEIVAEDLGYNKKKRTIKRWKIMRSRK